MVPDRTLATLKPGDVVTLDAWCVSCEAPYYRSTRPVTVGRDTLVPELFTPVHEGTPPPNPQRPVCPVCESPLRFVVSERVTTEGSPVSEAPTAVPPTRSGPELVTTLFECGPDEHVLDVKDNGSAYLAVTNRRIVYVAYADDVVGERRNVR